MGSNARTSSMSDNRFFYEELKKLSDALIQTEHLLDVEKYKNKKLEQLIDIDNNETGRKGE